MWASLLTEELLQFTAKPSLASLARVFLVSKLLLASPRHGGKQRSQAIEQMVRARIREWQAGCVESLWAAVQQQQRQQQRPRGNARKQEPPFRRAATLAKAGQVSKGCRLLCSRGIASGANEASLRQLFPAASEFPPPPQTILNGLQVEAKTVFKLVHQTSRYTAPGPSGLRMEHLQTALADIRSPHAIRLLDALTDLINLALSGTLPVDIAPFFCAGRLIPLSKKDGSIRPLVVGECLRSLTAKAGLALVGRELASAMEPLQQGLGGSRQAMHASILTAQSWAASLTPGDAILKVDISNAFNTVKRQACCAGLAQMEPKLLPYAQWTLCEASHIYCHSVDGCTLIKCETGVQQGDPLGPFLFSAALQTAVETTHQAHPLPQIWYLDDGILRGTIELLRRSTLQLETELTHIGLSLNWKKCELYSIDGLTEHEDFPLRPIVDTKMWSYLGAPLVSPEAACVSSAKTRSLQVNSQLAIMAQDFPMEALVLARGSAGACRVSHISGACNSSQLEDGLLVPCSQSLRNTLESILAVKIDGKVWNQATLPMRMGGLGLRDPLTEGAPTRFATLLTSKELALQLGAIPEHVDREIAAAYSAFQRALGGFPASVDARDKFLQKTLSDLLRQKQLTNLLNSGSSNDRQRLSSLCTPHALAWTTGASPWHVLTPFLFRSALRFVLHIPLGSSPYTCWDCQGSADAAASHAVRCTRTGAQTRGHYAVCSSLSRIASFTGIGVRTEQSIPGNDQLRPADLLLAHEGRQLAVDITVVSPPLEPDASHSHATEEVAGPVRSNARLGHLDIAVQRKKSKYSLQCERANWDFMCFAADIYGATHPTARELVGHLVKRLRPEEQPTWAASPGTLAWRAISAAIISRAAEQYGHAAEHYVSPTVVSELVDLTDPRSEPPHHRNLGTQPSPQPSCSVSMERSTENGGVPISMSVVAPTDPQLPTDHNAPPLVRFFSNRELGLHEWPTTPPVLLECERYHPPTSQRSAEVTTDPTPASSSAGGRSPPSGSAAAAPAVDLAMHGPAAGDLELARLLCT